MIQSQRNEYLKFVDIAKGIAILMAVIGQAFRDDTVLSFSKICDIKEIIYAFHLRLFSFYLNLF